MNAKDILVIALGAMIGWGWVVNSGTWIQTAGFMGSILAFAIGGTMIIFVSLTYAELTSAMPQCGGEHVFSYRAMGKNGSFVCTWAIILGYIAVAAFEAAALPSVFTYLFPNFNHVYLYTVAGYDIYLTSIILGTAVSLLIMFVNIAGVKMAAGLQTVLTVFIVGVGIIMLIGSAINGEATNLTDQFWQTDSGNIATSVFKVTCMTPFLFMGFDIIPQAAEEINVPYKRVGRIMILSVVSGIAFYMLMILAICLSMSEGEIDAEMASQTGVVAAKAMEYAFNSPIMGDVLIISGLCGIITSWNSFLMGGSRAMFSMGESRMLPARFGELGKNKTPVAGIVLCGVACIIAQFFGRSVLNWMCDVGSFACCVAYFMVSLSFVILRKKEPDMNRPYKVKKGMAVGIIAVIMAGFIVLLYILPFDWCATLLWQEWIIVAAWVVLGVFFYFFSKKKYGKEFARDIWVEVDKDLL